MQRIIAMGMCGLLFVMVSGGCKNKNEDNGTMSSQDAPKKMSVQAKPDAGKCTSCCDEKK